MKLTENKKKRTDWMVQRDGQLGTTATICASKGLNILKTRRFSAFSHSETSLDRGLYVLPYSSFLMRLLNTFEMKILCLRCGILLSVRPTWKERNTAYLQIRCCKTK
jgi:hypothetical protein